MVADFRADPEKAVGNVLGNMLQTIATGGVLKSANLTKPGKVGKVVEEAEDAASAVKKVGVQANREVGNAFRDEIAGLLKKEGRDVQTEVYKKTPFGKRFIDVEVSKGGKVLGGIETKSGSSRYHTLQRHKTYG